ncbi:MAG: phosphoheptose isomerase [Bdellovibrionales bacterium RBG_16_40_8]|nr:MAG: phosphoheptose isomerase [Bdellovibrionales bacterium RBG_16_40_8]
MDIKSVWQDSLGDSLSAINKFTESPEQIEKCVKFSEMLVSTIREGGNLFSCGNGGSHCDAMHFAEEFTGRYRKNRRPIGALALGNPSHVTCVSNDYGFEHIFSRELGGLGRKGDLLIGLSTSGNSQNVINAFTLAKEMEIKTVALLGRNGGKLKELADLAIVIPAETSDRIQEMHIKIIHIAIEAVERKIFPENY